MEESFRTFNNNRYIIDREMEIRNNSDGMKKMHRRERDRKIIIERASKRGDDRIGRSRNCCWPPTQCRSTHKEAGRAMSCTI